MLEKPNLPDEKVIACLRSDFGLPVAHLAFLPIGADQNTAVYRAVADDGKAYFVKLRGGIFDEVSVLLPRFLSDQGVRQIIAPLTTQTGQPWAVLDAFKLILYPFIDGRDGYQVELSDRHWIELGAALKRIHTLEMPPALTGRIQRESYSPQWRESVRAFLERVDDGGAAAGFDDPVAVQLAGFLKARRSEVLDLIERAERYARLLQARPSEFVVCHADLHAGNVLMDAGGRLYIVDWDTTILALKERDLMYAGGGQFGARRTPQEEEALFYQGYNPGYRPGHDLACRDEIADPVALAYYRYERIVQDLAVECEQIFLSSNGGEDRKQALKYLMSNFLPDSTIEIARKADTA